MRHQELGAELDVLALVKRLPPASRKLILLDERARLEREIKAVDEALLREGWDVGNES